MSRGQVAIQADGTVRAVNWSIGDWAEESCVVDSKHPNGRRRFAICSAFLDECDEGPEVVTFIWREVPSVRRRAKRKGKARK